MKLLIMSPMGECPHCEITKPTFIPRVGEEVFMGQYPNFIVTKVVYDLKVKEISVYTRTG